MYFCEAEECITIDQRENMCTVCAKPYPHHKRYQWVDGSDKTIKEVIIVSAHATCRNLTRQIDELQQKLIDAEYKLFIQRNQ